MRKALTMGALATLTVISLFCAGQESAPLAPDFELADLDGQTLNLSQFEGQVLVLNFWATWCPPCRAEIPDFIEVYNEYKDKGLGMIGISLDNMSEEELAPFVSDYGMTYPVALGTGQLVDDYKPGKYIPATIIVDKNGRIRTRHVGVMDRETLESLFLEYDKE